MFQNPQQVILDLLQFVRAQAALELTPPRAAHVALALDALANVILKNPGETDTCLARARGALKTAQYSNKVPFQNVIN